MNNEPEKPKSPVGRILLLNLGLVLLLHVGREMLAPQEGVFPLLFCLAFVDFLGALFIITQGGSGRKVATFLIAALLVFIVGFSDCASHFHLDTR
ncbi:hypothetical protein [Hymenobacter sp. NBH84]|uniref:hypothetical protein n=1 Tax=Hymenobacter sp. NBH84 TaxID=2596915 RepID=UPI001627F40F|nr:hypothetical protein [Hymenobacter sp. NBH84]